jgi:hypothetical protein
MPEASSFDVFETEWEHYLYRIEKIWERTEKVYKHQKSFRQWFAPYKALRKKDSLLLYLKQARNAETHTLQETISSPLSISVEEKYGREFNIKSISSKLENKCLTISLESVDSLLDLDTEVSRKRRMLYV